MAKTRLGSYIDQKQKKGTAKILFFILLKKLNQGTAGILIRLRC